MQIPLHSKLKGFSIQLGVVYATILFFSLIGLLSLIYYSTFVRHIEKIDAQILSEIERILSYSVPVHDPLGTEYLIQSFWKKRMGWGTLSIGEWEALPREDWETVSRGPSLDGKQEPVKYFYHRLAYEVANHARIQTYAGTSNAEIQLKPSNDLTLFLLAEKTKSGYNRKEGNLALLPQEMKFDEFFEFDFSVIKSQNNYYSDNQLVENVHSARAFAINFFRHPIEDGKQSHDYVLLVGRNIDDIKDLNALWLRALGISLILALALAAVGALFASHVMSRRLVKLNETVYLVMGGELSNRIELNGSNDEFDKLAKNVNHMLDRIEELVQRARTQSANIAHDLKTPLTRLKIKLEQLLRDSNKTEIEHSVLKQEVLDTIADADRLSDVFDAILRIEKVVSKTKEKIQESFDPHQIIDDVCSLYGPAAEDKSILLLRNEREPDLQIIGDKNLLFQALANLVENSIKFTPDNGQVLISGIQHKAGFEFVVADTGVGIPKKYYDNVCERFFRLESSRSTTGNGLGLSLVSAIAKYHNLDLVFADNEPGLIVRLKYFKLAK